MCTNSCTSFKKRRSERQGRIVYLRCNRAGIYESKGGQRTRGTKKKVSHCTAHLVVTTDENGAVKAKGCFGHIGHDFDPAKFRWTPQQEEFLRDMINEFSFDYAIRKLRETHDPQFSKLYFTTKKDLWNISSKYMLRPGCRHNDDFTSVILRSQEQNERDGIRFLELPKDGNNVRIVIVTPTQLKWLKRYGGRGIAIDDTFDLTRYNLKVAALMVADGRDRGVPAGFLISSHMVAADVACLFRVVKDLVPNFSPAALMSDEALAFFNGFKDAFPDSPTVLNFCRYHIYKTWTRRTAKIVKACNRREVNKAVSEILKIGDESSLRKRLAEVLSFLKENHEEEFLAYLQKYYLQKYYIPTFHLQLIIANTTGRIDEWASFTRHGLPLNTSMTAERWHNRLKTEKLQRSSSTRLDFLIETLINATEELDADTEVEDRRGYMNPYRARESNAAHRAAMTFCTSENIRRLDPGRREVSSASSGKTFLVYYDNKCKCDAKLNLHCLKCGVCAYQFRCNCFAGSKAGISCEHLHALLIFGSVGELPEDNVAGDQDVEPIQAEVSLQGTYSSKTFELSAKEREHRRVVVGSFLVHGYNKWEDKSPCEDGNTGVKRKVNGDCERAAYVVYEGRRRARGSTSGTFWHLIIAI